MGALDVMRDAVVDILDPFTDIPLTFRRVDKSAYNPLTGVESPVSVDVNIKASPLLQWTENELQDDTLRKTDLKVIVPSKLIDASGISLRPDTEVQIFCIRGGLKYKVIPYKIVESGDKEAIVILGLRK